MPNELETQSAAALAQTARRAIPGYSLSPTPQVEGRAAVAELERRASAYPVAVAPLITKEPATSLGNRIRAALIGQTAPARYDDVAELERRALVNEAKEPPFMASVSPLSRLATAALEAGRNPQPTTWEHFRALLSEVCKAASMDVTVAGMVPRSGGGELFDMHPNELARPAGSWSHKVADDGKCKPEDLAAIAEINGFYMSKSVWQSKAESVEMLRGRARVLGCKFEPPLPPAESCAAQVERFEKELGDLVERHGVEIDLASVSASSAPLVSWIKDTTVEQAMKNMGHDTTCGACMGLAFTGARTEAHTCKQNEAARTIAALDTIYEWCNNNAYIARFFIGDKIGRTHQIILKEKSESYSVEGSQNIITSRPFRSVESRVKCLEAAAAWCKKEMGR